MEEGQEGKTEESDKKGRGVLGDAIHTCRGASNLCCDTFWLHQEFVASS